MLGSVQEVETDLGNAVKAMSPRGKAAVEAARGEVENGGLCSQCSKFMEDIGAPHFRRWGMLSERILGIRMWW